MGILTSCKPRAEVLKGDLDDAIFAADFGSLIAGQSVPKVYGDAASFFQNTHPAKQLCAIVQAVFGRLADPQDAGATIRLSTGFGGGKTHTLMALWHLAHHIEDAAMGTELLPAAGRPTKVTVAAIDAGKAGIPVFLRHGKVVVKSLWGELAYQLGGEKAWKALSAVDDPEHQPDEALLESLMPSGPVLILLDELVIYMATLSDRGQGNALAFLNKLAAVVARRPQTVLVVTDPAGQVAYAQQSANLQQALSAAAVRLDEMFSRRMTDFDPIGDEAARVIVRRLFEWIDPGAAQAASALYFSLYQRVAQDQPGMIPPAAATPAYGKRIVECYPFHPRLLDTAQDRLGAMEAFQRSRGVLRMFARLVRDVWEKQIDHELITAGEIDWSSPRIQDDLVQRVNRDNFKAAISADIQKHAAELDGGSPEGIHMRVASALLLESLPLQPNSGLAPDELTLAVLRPDEAGPEPSEALDRLTGVCWHTYPMPGGRGWHFRYEPNIIKQIEERMADISIEDAKATVRAEAQQYFKGPIFNLIAWPATASQVQDSADLQLVLCEDEDTAREVCAYSDHTDPQAPLPRRFLNAIVAVAARSEAFEAAIDRARRLKAAEAIRKENQSNDAGKLVRDQLQRTMPELRKAFRVQTCRAFDRIVLAGNVSYGLEEQFQVSEEQLLAGAEGQDCVLRFLKAKRLIYVPGDALDSAKFVKDILPGTTPLPDQPGVYSARAIHERLLGAPGLRLIQGKRFVRDTLNKALDEGKIVLRMADGRGFDATGCVEGPEGRRRRINALRPELSLNDSEWITTTGSEYARAWLHEDTDKPPSDGLGPPPPERKRVTATTWEDVRKYVADRPLLRLQLQTTAPAASRSLLKLAQPLSADSLSLSLSVGGEAKEGGMIDFRVSDVKPTHPTSPLKIAQTLFNALQEERAQYDAQLALDFGEAGRTGLAQQLNELADNAPDEVTPEAEFGQPVGGES